MKTSRIIELVMAIALVVACAKLVTSKQDNAQVSTNDANGVIENIMTRTSVRAYTEKTVERSKIDTLLHAGMAAPSGKNKQPWFFYAVTDKAHLEALSQSSTYAGMVARAPLAIVVCGDMEKAGNDGFEDLWLQDCSAASENILLAAHALGLGAVWTTSFPSEERMAGVRKALDMPEHLMPLNIIAIGYPEGETQPKDKWNEENVSIIGE